MGRLFEKLPEQPDLLRVPAQPGREERRALRHLVLAAEVQQRLFEEEEDAVIARTNLGTLTLVGEDAKRGIERLGDPCEWAGSSVVLAPGVPTLFVKRKKRWPKR